jgi:ATP/maltotriose-dependent transcriptional regulator MalT
MTHGGGEVTELPLRDSADRLRVGREAYRRHAWRDAYDALSIAAQTAPLEAEDLWQLAFAAHLIGHDDEFLAVLEKAHHAHLDSGNDLRAARCAFWIGFRLFARGEGARGSGWIGRASRLVERAETECVERGLLMLPMIHQSLGGGDYDAAFSMAANAVEIGERFREPDLVALALHLQGRALLGQTRVDEGLALLDEAMVGVSAGEVSPLVSGLVYCSTIGACRKVYAMRQVQEWTEALSAWCERQPDLGIFNGECLVYRAEIMQMHGAWSAALDEARKARESFARREESVPLSLAYYLEGEIHRLLGQSDAAEKAYRNASRLGREPHPGLALLRLAEGKADVAAASIRRALSETRDPLQRARLIPAHVEISLAVGDVAEARTVSDELEKIAETYPTSVLGVLVEHVRGEVSLFGGDAATALVSLRRAAQGWIALAAPYEAARARLLLGSACRALGDDDSAALDFEAARVEFERLGAAVDLEKIYSYARSESPAPAHGLTARELEVLGLVARGKSNKRIAADLAISEKTVARHVSNIFGKLGISSRSAATAYAYENDLA